MGNARAYALHEACRSRDYLTRFLTPIAGDRAERIACHLIEEFGTLSDLLASEPRRLKEACAGDPLVQEQILLFQDMMRHTLKFRLVREPILSNMQNLRDYLVERLAFLTHEVALGLFLDSRNGLIQDVVLSQGTLTQAPVFPREIAKRALALGATALVLVHNHPSGDCAASRADICITRDIVKACRTIDVDVHDHVIIARSGFFSMRAEGLM